MSDLISKQVLDLWNRYKPTIAVDAIEYDRELKKLLSTNLASLGTDCISRQQAIDALEKWLHGLFGITEADGTATIFKTIKQLPPIQPKRGKWKITNLGAVGAFDSCSECKRVVKHKAPFYNFCPNCGADMREVTT